MSNLKKPVFGYGPSKKTRIVANIAFALIAVLIVVAIIALVKDKNRNKPATNKPAAGKIAQEVTSGQALSSRYFDIMVEESNLVNGIVDSPGTINLPVDRQYQYLIITTVLKNNDTESKMMPEGELRIETKEEELTYRKPETILAKGWGMVMENIAPGSTVKAKLVYKIPADIQGKLYYYPDISYSKDRIYLTSL